MEMDLDLGVHNQGTWTAHNQGCWHGILDYEQTLADEPTDDSSGMDFSHREGSLSGSDPNMSCAPVVPASEQTDEIHCSDAETVDSESDQASAMLVSDHMHSVLLDVHCLGPLTTTYFCTFIRSGLISRTTVRGW